MDNNLYEIEKINERVALQIGRQAERTKEIVTLEDETRQRFIELEMPRSMFKYSDDQYNTPSMGGPKLGV